MQLTKKVIAQALHRFDEMFEDTMRSEVSLLDRILQDIAAHKGKQMRPMFVLLCAQLGGEINDSSYRAALLVELLHTASLVHDDMVDDAMKRRSAFSVNALWKNRISVMVGDHLFTKGVLLMLSNQDFDLLKIYSDAIRQMSEGELLQMTRLNKLHFEEQAYYDLIHAKTASFLAAACAAGAASTCREQAAVDRLHAFGRQVGMAFQLKDDLFDYGHTDIGKPTGNDIKEKKITLPLIYTLQHSDTSLRKKILHIIKHKNTDREQVNFILETVHRTGGLEYATEKMFAFRDEAFQLLYTFPASPTRDALEELVRYTTDRKY
ncbi:polyprenyl synthetase family protein [Chitinophaga nivalis]|uniref:Polyprenyl synthetase family protein n=1 Tax=Chitinophaga nivalis TaxID=2991709 RepID=A0ABT3IR34_9BACT|nr:polyprenyl synthetase family protein [Chitinophaga nivalis]MCW3463897.1 polyprenyl synthetase family protein [Chitinophaga nivalis]MCW3486413.1 polyprenyl synthetase family protein [Chitinophaga nivalis]